MGDIIEVGTITEGEITRCRRNQGRSNKSNNYCSNFLRRALLP